MAFRWALNAIRQRSAFQISSNQMFGTDFQMGGSEEAIAVEAFEMALEMCANEGQLSVIEMTSLDAFYEAAEAAHHEDDAVDVLMGACPYPEAVGIILEEVGMFINDSIQDQKGDNGDVVEGETSDVDPDTFD